MTAPLVADRRSLLAPRPGSRGRRARNAVATALIALTFLIALVPLVFIVGYVVQRGSEIIELELPHPAAAVLGADTGAGDGSGGGRDALDHRRGGADGDPARDLRRDLSQRVRREEPARAVVRFLSEVMTGVPSIVMGLFIYTFVVLHTHEKNAFAGALALACLMLPIVIRTTDQMLALVPSELREGSYALGSRRARTIRTVVLPSAAPGIVSGALLAVARAAGETAPLLFTIGLVEDHTNWSLFNGTNTALSTQIFSNAAVAVPERAGPGLGGRAHADPDRLHGHDRRPARDRILRPSPGGLTLGRTHAYGRRPCR